MKSNGLFVERFKQRESGECLPIRPACFDAKRAAPPKPTIAASVYDFANDLLSLEYQAIVVASDRELWDADQVGMARQYLGHRGGMSSGRAWTALLTLAVVWVAARPRLRAERAAMIGNKAAEERVKRRRGGVGMGTRAMLGLLLVACGGSGMDGVVTSPDASVPAPDGGLDDGGTSDMPDDLAALLAPIREGRSLPALAAAVVDAEDGLVALGAVGQRRSGGTEPVTPDDRWHLGSDTKAMTATLAALLVEDEALSWETTLAQGFPTLAERMHPEFADVTLVELLTHRAGLTGNLAVERAEVWTRLWEAREPLADERLWFAEQLLTAPPAVTPRSEVRYANAGYMIAGALMEQATGEAWETLLGTRLFTPLGMDSCGFGPAATVGQVDAPWGHRGDEPVPPGPAADNPPALGPAGTVHCSLADWAKFIALHLRGARGDTELLPQAAFARLQAGPGFATPEEGPEYAYGWLVVNAPWAGGTALNHVGSNTMNLANAWLVPGRGRAYLVVTNAGGEAAFGGTDQIVAALVGAYPPHCGGA